MAFEDTSIAKMAVAVAGEAPHSGAPAPRRMMEAPVRHLPLTEGVEVYLDGKVGAVVASTDKEIDRKPHTVLVQSRGQSPYEVEIIRCWITAEGRYPHPSVYRAGEA